MRNSRRGVACSAAKLELRLSVYVLFLVAVQIRKTVFIVIMKYKILKTLNKTPVEVRRC